MGGPLAVKLNGRRAHPATGTPAGPRAFCDPEVDAIMPGPEGGRPRPQGRRRYRPVGAHVSTKEHVLAIDEGSTGVRALVFDAASTIRGGAYREIAPRYPGSGLVEHDPEEIWEATLVVVRGALADATLGAGDLAAIGITNQRATTVLWDAATGRAVHAAISWQDLRTAARCAALAAQGCWLSPLHSATKVEWLLANVPQARARAAAGRLRFGTIDSWLAWRLSGGRIHATEHSNASCTGLYSFADGDWDRSVVQLLELPAELLPALRPSSAVYGHTAPEVLGAEVPIAGIAGDQQAAMFGQLCVEPGAVKATYGTSAMVDLHTGLHPVLSARGAYPLVLWQIDGERPFCLEGTAITAGAAVQWLRDGLGIIARLEDVEPLARSVDDSAGVWAVPAFQGLGTPHSAPAARAIIGGISRGTTRAHIARAVLEGIAFRGREVLETLLLDGATPRPAALRVDGGAARNDLLMQLQADTIGIPVERPTTVQAAALGAAYLAGCATGVWRGVGDLRGTWRRDRTFEPRLDDAAREERWTRWQRAVRTALAAEERS
jgi:glycerol kinase